MTATTPRGDGVRQDWTVTFVSRRVVDGDGTRVRRLLVEDEQGERHALLVRPEVDHCVGLRTGERYQFQGVLGCTPPAPAGDETCPHCGEPLRQGGTLDTLHAAVATAVDRLGIEEPFGVVDDRTVVRAVDDARRDDWHPMHQPDERRAAPDYVCTACGRPVDAWDLERAAADVEESVSEMEFRASRGVHSTEASMAAPTETLGMATGGAKDADTFRANVENGYTPQPEAISDEGLFYDYHFETGEASAEPDGEPTALFAPRYATAVTDHPLTGETERYVSVGLDSRLSPEGFERPRLDLVVALDVSGSMTGAFDGYYYDEHGRRHETESDASTKLEAATESLCALTRQLRDDDRLGIVLYDHRAHVAKPLREVGATDMDAIRRHVRSIAAGGSTNLEDGFEAARDLLQDGELGPAVERRVVFMTDMMPNTGATAEGDLTSRFADAAVDGVHTTFVGMGLDANAELLDALSGIRGANHYVVNSAAEFERRLGEEFDYMVTPLVYDLTLDLETDGYEIEAIHGSPASDPATGRLVHVGTLFPSPTEDGEARGGVVLVRVTQTDPDADLDLVASWTERTGRDHVERVSVDVPDAPETFAHDGVRKAVALARYARELRAWAADVHGRADRATGVDDWLLPERRGHHEHESVPLVVPDEYAERFATTAAYLAAEREALGDDALDQELDLLDRLCAAADVAVESPEVTD
jgi:Ca-activated chloride channel family protein